jgi:hypothetical protein
VRWCYDNYWDDYDIDSYSTQNSNFPATNTQNTILSTAWRTTTVATAATAVIDAGSGNTITADSVIFSGHNFTSGATIKIQGHTSDAWGAPDIDETVTYRSDHCVKFFTSAAKRFWRIYVLDTTNTDDYIEIGRVFLGEYLDIDPSSLINFPVTYSRNDLVTVTDQRTVYATPGTTGRVFSYQWPETLWTMTQSLRTVYETVGLYKPFYHFNLNTDYTFDDPAYVIFGSDYKENRVGNQRMTWSMNLLEVN